MMEQDRFPERLELLRRTLDHHQDFVRGFDLALPAVNRLHTGQDIDAGSHPLLYQATGDASGLLSIGTSGKNNLKIGHMFTNYGSFDCKRENFPKRHRVH